MVRCGEGWDIYGKEAAGIITSSLTPVCGLIPYFTAGFCVYDFSCVSRDFPNSHLARFFLTDSDSASRLRKNLLHSEPQCC